MRKKTVKIDFLDVGNETNVLNISIDKLFSMQRKNDVIFETPREYFLIAGFLAFRALKQKAMPKILKVNTLEINSDAYSVKACVEPEDLLDFALKGNILVFETRDQFLIPTDIWLFANKKKEVKT